MAGRCRHFRNFWMPSSSAPIAVVARFLRRFRRNRRGSAAVEFALVAPMFFGLLFAIVETAMVFFANEMLETITQDSARIIQTGQAMTPGGVSATQTGPLTAAQFQQYVCTQIPALFSCDNVYIDVESYSPSQAWPASFSNQIDSNGNFISSNLQYDTGGPCDVVIVRLFYQWPLFVTGLGFNLSNLAGNKRLLWSSAAFRNEPYGTCATS
jgi:Flp pilus assembly pilin Flp